MGDANIKDERKSLGEIDLTVLQVRVCDQKSSL